ncbi:hypothetical protein OFY17_08720 [Marinomonas sp. C2222]|uniref:Uncharacterized protein n=1 Tax=Marinomonas sargassi TaxID=2984494 RepID=A0ABT2YSU0_9GAMM|nr:hypothetical protein [Marinomonas sargassi]MCV2402961.1 hypothetical protein [Marinomonas sargassi]
MERKNQLKELARTCGTEITCPYCEYQLDKIPKRKAKCKSCKKSIYPRNESLSGKIRLYRFLIEELKALSDGNWEAWFEANGDVLEARKYLAKEWKLDEVNVLVSDAKWRVLNKNLSIGVSQNDWEGVFLTYCSMLRQIQGEKNTNSGLLASLVAGFMISGYGRERESIFSNSAYRIGRPQYTLIHQLAINPDDILSLIQETDAGKTYCSLLGGSLNTIIDRYKAEVSEDKEKLKSLKKGGV